MSDMKRVDPALIKKAAEMARPGCQVVYEHQFSDGHFQLTICDESGRQHTFDPAKLMDDAFMLERALKKEGWWFGQFNDLKYGATRYADKARNRERIDICDNSDTLLLLKCVSAMTGIELYV